MKTSWLLVINLYSVNGLLKQINGRRTVCSIIIHSPVCSITQCKKCVLPIRQNDSSIFQERRLNAKGQR